MAWRSRRSEPQDPPLPRNTQTQTVRTERTSQLASLFVWSPSSLPSHRLYTRLIVLPCFSYADAEEEPSPRFS
jgi:hypothetical protein